MRRFGTTVQVLLAAAIWTLLGIGAAYAPGTITLDEVMEQLKDNQALISEIDAALKAENLQAENVICIGSRFGGHWVELGGGRSVPYECKLGKRKLNIDGTVHLYDAGGAEIDMNDEKAPERAADYKQTDLKWTWE